jgi:hypothetical protein
MFFGETKVIVIFVGTEQGPMTVVSLFKRIFGVVV